MATTLLSSCRDEVLVYYPTEHDTGHTGEQTDVAGLYVLNEGNMGANKATLDYLDLHTGIYQRNIFPLRNPDQVMELGDVGNDIQVYGSQLWMVINCSNKVEVCDASTARSRGHVDIPNCRFVTFHEGYAYVSAYVGRLREDVLGGVYKVDTTTLQVVDMALVGHQPEELAVVGDRLYVANSGGYQALQGKGYDHTLSVIDLKTFRVTGEIDVAPNLFRLRADSHGQLWVTSRGNYAALPPRLYVLCQGSDGRMAVDKEIDIPVTDLAFRGDSLIYCGIEEGLREDIHHFGVINTVSREPLATLPLEAQADPDMPGIEMPYGLKVHPLTGDLYLMDATNYVSSGRLFCFDSEGHFKWWTWTGDIPGHGAFLVTTTHTP